MSPPTKVNLLILEMPHSRSSSCVHTMTVDVNALKGRIGEALVEGILREARFKVSRLGRDTQVQRLLKTGSSEFLPDFLVWKPAEQLENGVPLHRLLSVEVKYRSNVEEFLRRFGDELISHVGEQWRELYVVLLLITQPLGALVFRCWTFGSLRPTPHWERSISTKLRCSGSARPSSRS